MYGGASSGGGNGHMQMNSRGRSNVQQPDGGYSQYAQQQQQQQHPPPPQQRGAPQQYAPQSSNGQQYYQQQQNTNYQGPSQPPPPSANSAAVQYQQHQQQQQPHYTPLMAQSGYPAPFQHQQQQQYPSYPQSGLPPPSPNAQQVQQPPPSPYPQSTTGYQQQPPAPAYADYNRTAYAQNPQPTPPPQQGAPRATRGSPMPEGGFSNQYSHPGGYQPSSGVPPYNVPPSSGYPASASPGPSPAAPSYGGPQQGWTSPPQQYGQTPPPHQYQQPPSNYAPQYQPPQQPMPLHHHHHHHAQHQQYAPPSQSTQSHMPQQSIHINYPQQQPSYATPPSPHPQQQPPQQHSQQFAPQQYAPPPQEQYHQYHTQPQHVDPSSMYDSGSRVVVGGEGYNGHYQPPPNLPPQPGMPSFPPYPQMSQAVPPGAGGQGQHHQQQQGGRGRRQRDGNQNMQSSYPPQQQYVQPPPNPMHVPPPSVPQQPQYPIVPPQPPPQPTLPQPDEQYDLYHFLSQKGLVERHGLHDLIDEPQHSGTSNTKIAIDANYALIRIRESLRTEDPLWFLHSSLPKLLLDLVKLEVENLRDVGLEPVYVFNGIGPSGDVEAFLTPPNVLQERANVWRELEEHRLPEKSFELNDTFDIPLGEDVEMAVARYLREQLNVTVVVAPFLNWPQMIVMHKEGDVKLLFAPPEALMLAYDDVELIMDINLKAPEVPIAVVKRKKVLETLFGSLKNPDGTVNYSRAGDRFLDLCLLTTTHPAVQPLRAPISLSISALHEELAYDGRGNYESLKDIIDKSAASLPLESASSGGPQGTDGQSQGSKSEWLKHAKGRAFMRHCVVFSKKKEQPLMYLSQALSPPGAPPPRVPANISGVFGNMVPMSLFFFQYCGLLSVSSMTCITQTYVCDEGPLCDSDEFHESMNVLISLRTQVTYQLVRELSSSMGSPAAATTANIGTGSIISGAPAIQNNAYSDRLKSISWVRWFRPVLQPVVKPAEIIKLDDWSIPASLIDVFEDDVTKIQLDQVLALNPHAIPSAPRGGKCIGLYKRRTELYCAVLLKSFDLLGYFTHAVQTTNGDDDTPTEVQSGLSPFSLEIKYVVGCDPAHQYQYILLTELVRTQSMTAKPLTFSDDADANGYASREPEVDQAVELVCRVACAMALDTQIAYTYDQLWKPIYNRSIVGFMMIARMTNRALRELVEVMAVSTYLDGSAHCPLSDFVHLAQDLPFGAIPNALGALLIRRAILDGRNSPSQEVRIHKLQQEFPMLSNVAASLKEVLTFVLHGLHLLNVFNVTDQDMVDSDLNEKVPGAVQIVVETWRNYLVESVPVCHVRLEDTVNIDYHQQKLTKHC